MLDSIESQTFNQDSFDLLFKQSSKEHGLEFFECAFKGIDFSSFDFAPHKFHDCTFENSQMSNVQLGNSTLRSCSFKGSKLLGAQFFKGNGLSHLHFLDCLLDYVNFQNLKMVGWSFQGSQLREAEFYHCECGKVNFSHCELSGTRFVDCNLESADFRLAKNYFIDVKVNKIKKAQFSSPEVLALLKSFEIEIH